jgi:hypothetical protein
MIFSKMESNDFQKASTGFGFEFEYNTKADAFYLHYNSKALHQYKNKCMAP